MKNTKSIKKLPVKDESLNENSSESVQLEFPFMEVVKKQIKSGEGAE